MTEININDYVLVKDKDGQLKYYKDGQFYSIDEIESKVEGEKEKIEEKKAPVILKPVMTLEQQQESKKPEVQVVKKPELKPIETKIDVEEIKSNPELNVRRSEDQKVIEDRVQHIIEKLKIQFSDESIQRRFVNVLTTYFRGIRREKEIEYILTLPKISGGMGLPADKVGLIISLLSHHSQDLNKDRKDITTKAVNQVATLDHRLAPPPPALIEAVPLGNKPQLDSAVAPKPIIREKTMVKPPILKMTPKSVMPVEKATVQDVKPATRRLTGPVEELQYMTLEDFRRLGRDKKEIKDEVIERVMLLGEETLMKKIQGIKAWKSSPVFKLYLQLSLKGIQEKKSVEKLIEESQTRNEETLTLSEVELISELNQALSF